MQGAVEKPSPTREPLSASAKTSQLQSSKSSGIASGYFSSRLCADEWVLDMWTNRSAEGGGKFSPRVVNYGAGGGRRSGAAVSGESGEEDAVSSHGYHETLSAIVVEDSGGSVNRSRLGRDILASLLSAYFLTWYI